jgi:hypothetical protein
MSVVGGAPPPPAPPPGPPRGPPGGFVEAGAGPPPTHEG